MKILSQIFYSALSHYRKLLAGYYSFFKVLLDIKCVILNCTHGLFSFPASPFPHSTFHYLDGSHKFFVLLFNLAFQYRVRELLCKCMLSSPWCGCSMGMR